MPDLGGLIKVGKAERGWKSRLAAQQTGNPFRIECLATLPCLDYDLHEIEQALHRAMRPSSKQRIGGGAEWFYVTRPVRDLLYAFGIWDGLEEMTIDDARRWSAPNVWTGMGDIDLFLSHSAGSRARVADYFQTYGLPDVELSWCEDCVTDTFWEGARRLAQEQRWNSHLTTVDLGGAIVDTLLKRDYLEIMGLADDESPNDVPAIDIVTGPG